MIAEVVNAVLSAPITLGSASVTIGGAVDIAVVIAVVLVIANWAKTNIKL